MDSRRHASLLAAALLVLGITAIPWRGAAHAANVPLMLEDSPAAGVFRALATCTLEPAGALGPTFTVFGLGERWYSHYTLLTACPSCPAALDLRNVRFRVRWASGVCTGTSYDLELSIVGSTGDPGCPVPDTTHVLCGPTLHTLTSPGVPTIHTLPLPTGCCASPGSFLRVKYLGVTGGDCVAITNTVVAAPPCVQYFSTTVNYTGITPTTTINGGQWFAIDAECCEPTPALRESWGRLKTLYR